jgi:hypothetical protein
MFLHGIVNRTVPKIIVISVHTVNRFPLIIGLGLWCLKSIYLSCLSLFSILLTTLCMTLESYSPFNPGDISLFLVYTQGFLVVYSRDIES